MDGKHRISVMFLRQRGSKKCDENRLKLSAIQDQKIKIQNPLNL
jgi:hypothetical protein